VDYSTENMDIKIQIQRSNQERQLRANRARENQRELHPPPHAEPQTEKVNNDTEEPEIMDNRTHSSPPPNGKNTGAHGQAEGTLEVVPSPTYADISRKKVIDPSSSSEDEILERPAKRAGRKSRKEAREEEAERQKT
jgi:hypothetical protein